jgi:copper(I)-binding protein
MTFRFISGLIASLLALPCLAQVTVSEPWVRGTVPEQKASGAFMSLTSQTDSRLVQVQSPVAATVEIHEMKMDGGVMRMRPIADLALPAGKAVSLAPGGYHVMLIGLKQVLKPGDQVPLTLVVEGADKQRQQIEVKAAVRPLNSAAGAAPAAGSAHKH